MAKVEHIVFLSLVLDLFGAFSMNRCIARPLTSVVVDDHAAFTIPLPLFPRIIEWYTQARLSLEMLQLDYQSDTCLLARD